MPAVLTGHADDHAVAELYATALLEGPLPVHTPASAEKSGLIDQAYSEYRNLCAAGVEVDPDAFCARFPAYQTSLRRLLEVHREVEANPNVWRGLDRWPAAGEHFFGFQLEAELGRGAFARVFLAREPDVGNRQVVVKVSLHADDEADTLGKLRHPNVVEILHRPKADVESGFSVVCMKFSGGATLLRVIEALATRTSLPGHGDFLLAAAQDERWPADSAAPPARAMRRGSYQDAVLYLGERLASALAYVHERGILHRDLKPTNVLLCPNGEPVLIDFNLAYDRTMVEHRLGGTLPYMPPEQLTSLAHHRKGEPVPADNRSDLYALGVILYELLAGAHPFGPVPLKLKTAEARSFLLERQQRGPLPLRARNRSIDPGLEALIARCLNHDPAGRPATAREMVAELRRLQSPIRRARRWAIAHMKTLAVAGVLVGSSSAAAAGYVANLPTHVHKAERLYRDGDFAAAEAEYDAALLGNPNQPAVHFARGRALLKQGKLGDAITAFKAADPKTNAASAACVAYCRALQKSPKEGIEFGLDAIQGGFASDAVLTNLAYCCGIDHKYDEAESFATQALEKTPTLRAAFYNRATVRFKQWIESKNPVPGVAFNPVPGLAMLGLEDIREAVNRGATTANAYYYGAALCAAELSEHAGNPIDDPLYAEGKEFMRQAVANGYSNECIGNGAKSLKVLADWAAQLPHDLKIEHRANGTDLGIRLIDPVTD